MYDPPLKTENKTFEFKGYPNGGDESLFCWDVDKKTFIKIKETQPSKYDKSISREGFYKIYPEDFYGLDNPMCKMRLTIEVITE